MFRNKSVDVKQFAMVPRADIPRSSFRIQKSHKTTFDGGLLYPIYVDEVLPGDSFDVKMTAFARLATPLYPVMDNIHLESFFFFVPCRLVWNNWRQFMGQQANPSSSISFTVPQVSSATAWAQLSIFDYMGLPTVNQVVGTEGLGINALPLRAYNLIWNEWFRDENLQNQVNVIVTDGPDAATTYQVLRRGKRHDYFTSCLPWTQKGGISAKLPLGTFAEVKSGTLSGFSPQIPTWQTGAGASMGGLGQLGAGSATSYAVDTAADSGRWLFPGLVADLTTATAATINELRQSFQIQKLLERDARGGTRYTELVRSHFGVVSPDSRLQRPEYLGGGSTPINITPIAQTSETLSAGSGTPQGKLSGIGQAVGQHHFRGSFTEHGYIIGLINARADLSYQQGVRKLWSRKTRYDFYFPVFAQLGEQAVLNKEIYAVGTLAQDDAVFGYQERWAEYRYNPSQITGLFRSTAVGTLDAWHLAQRFTSLPVLATGFVADVPPIERVVAVGALAGGQQFLLDTFFDIKAARPLPMYSVPGLVDHF